MNDDWLCPRCKRSTKVAGGEADVHAALSAVRLRHETGHAAGDHYLDEVGLAGAGARATARARRADRRAASRRRAKRAA